MIDVSGIADRVSELLAEYSVPSAAVGILQDGQVTDFAVGCRDLASAVPATTETIYQCGSMTKTWTALAFLQLVGEGRADLDEPVRTYLPGFRTADPDVSARVTARHLLNHTNGIEEAFGDPGEGDDVLEHMVAGIARAPQVHPLGSTHGYSAALGYAILARIIEVIDGRCWDAIMQQRLFGPLGLAGTGTRPAQVERGRAATGYLVRPGLPGPVPSPVQYLPRAYGPGGNVSSTAREVLAMAHVILSGGLALSGTRLIPAWVIREMTRSRVPVPDPYLFGPEWALGLVVGDWQGETVYASDGSTIGQSARLRLLPDSGIAICLLANAGPSDAFYRSVFGEVLAGLGGPEIPALPAPDPRLRLDPSRYVGTYARPGPRYAVTTEQGNLGLDFILDPLHARTLGKPERVQYSLLPVSETHFLMRSDDPAEDTQTVAIYDFGSGAAGYLHTNCRVYPRVGGS